MKEQHHKWYSPNLNKDMEMLEFGHYGYPIIIFPSTKGRYHEAKDFYLIDSVAHLIEDGKIKIYCPDSIDAWSWYNRSIHPADRVKNHMWYDSMILEELIGKIEDVHGSTKVAVAGCSFGGIVGAASHYKLDAILR
ncbi:MAG: hypothetical protein AAF391_12900 [Bacteroidota bacterium]